MPFEFRGDISYLFHKRYIHHIYRPGVQLLQELKTEIEISASPQRVWQVLTDFAAFGTWNTFIPQIKGEPALHSKLHIIVNPPLGKRMMLKPILTKVDPQKELRWLGALWGMRFLFAGEHFFKIEPLTDNSVTFIHGEKFSGLLLPILWKFMEEQIKMGYLQFNRDIKKECEL